MKNQTKKHKQIILILEKLKNSMASYVKKGYKNL